MFKTFPQFSRLTLDDREAYEAFIKDFPPIGDISFNQLMLWWETIGSTAIAQLDKNLVVSYWIPGDEEQSGLSLIGTEDVDKSICAIFDYLRDKRERPRLVNVPEFVVYALRYPELFSFKASPGREEYIVSVSKFTALESMPQYMRIRIRKFIREHGKDNLFVKDINLKSIINRELLTDASERWPRKGVNNMSEFGRRLLPIVVSSGAKLDVRCLGLYCGEKLCAYCLYSPTHDERYITLLNVRVDYEMPRIFGSMAHAFAEHLHAKGVVYVNLYSDSDSAAMRIVKIAVRPDNFFRKYTIEPA